jgi:hypothetical protein
MTSLSANLIDAAMAAARLGVDNIRADPRVEHAPLVYSSLALTNSVDVQPLETNLAAEASSISFIDRESELGDVSWLTDELLERVFG